jgi:hypothetical protein
MMRSLIEPVEKRAKGLKNYFHSRLITTKINPRIGTEGRLLTLEVSRQPSGALGAPANHSQSAVYAAVPFCKNPFGKSGGRNDRSRTERVAARRP